MMKTITAVAKAMAGTLTAMTAIMPETTKVVALAMTNRKLHGDH